MFRSWDGEKKKRKRQRNLIHPSLAIERLGAHCKSRKLVNLCSGLPLVVSKLGWRKEKEKETEEQKETERKRKRKRKMNGDEWLPGGGGDNKNGAVFLFGAPIKRRFFDFRKK